MAGGADDRGIPAGVKKMADRLKAAGNPNVKHTIYEGASHSEASAAMFKSVELVDWMMGFKLSPKLTGSWSTSDGIQAFQFETSALKGSFIAGDQRDLPRGYARHGLRGLVLQPSGKDPHPPVGKVGGKRRHHGMLNLYRVYSATESFGALRDENANIEQAAAGAILSWPATERRPVAVSATWKITGPTQIDLTIAVDPKRDIENFEILLANYVALDLFKGIYTKKDGALVFGGSAVQGDDYGFYPLNKEARKSLGNSGRVHSSWKWPSFIPEDNAALPLAVAGNDSYEILLMSDPQSTSAICVTPNREDGAPPETWTNTEQHSSMYLSFFSRNVRAGERLTANARLVLHEKPSDPSEAHQKIYARFLKDISDDVSEPASSKSSTSKPFPHNRIRNYYEEEARRILARGDQPMPELLPEFPGLDGGKFGHWGQNDDASYTDKRLNEMDMGGMVSQVVKHFGRTTVRAVVVAAGDDQQASALFDTERLTFTDSWKGGKVVYDSKRFGVNAGVKPGGKRLLDLGDSAWTREDGEALKLKFLGLYRNGKRVVFHYLVDGIPVYDQVWFNDGKLTRTMTVDGALDPGITLRSPLPPNYDKGETKRLAMEQAPQWRSQQVITRGKMGSGSGPYVIDTLTIPYRDENPFGTPFRVSGFDFLPDGRAAVSTLMGDVWLLDGIDDKLEKLTWKRYAAGLHQPLGLLVKDGKIIVLGRDQVTRLHDVNGDDEADFYECVTNDYPATPGSAFACTLHQDQDGTLYWFTQAKGFQFTRFTEGTKPESIATGLRNSNGIGVSADGDLLLATSQEGTWTPATAIFEVGNGSYHGFNGPKKGRGKYNYDLPLCFIPRGIDSSSGDIAFLPQDDRFGALSGKVLGTSAGACSHYLILREEIGGRSQGGVVPLPGDFLSGAHRSRYNPHDGQFYVAGTAGWASYYQKPGSLQRVRYQGGELHLPESIETRSNGLIVRFNTAIDPESVSLKNAFCEQWNYLYSRGYGSSEYSVKKPGVPGHDPVEIRSLHLLEGGRALFVEIPQLHPVMQLHLYLDLKTANGTSFTPDIYYSIIQIGDKPFTRFPGYVKIAKDPYPEFPIQGSYPIDRRLVAQERLGKSLAGFETAEVKCVPGLQFEPRRIRMRAGRRAAIVLKNVDVEMPHNLVIVKPDRLRAIGEASMKLAADPSAVEKHYVPQDQGVIAMSRLVNPKEQYSIYFKTPEKAGEYPFICTFPGHWMIMRGILEIVKEEEK